MTGFRPGAGKLQGEPEASYWPLKKGTKDHWSHVKRSSEHGELSSTHKGF